MPHFDITNSQTPDRALTINQAAERAQVSRGTMYRYVRDGVIPAARLRTTWRISAEQLERLLSSPRRGEDR